MPFASRLLDGKPEGIGFRLKLEGEEHGAPPNAGRVLRHR